MSNFTRYDADLNIQYHKQASKILGKRHWVVTKPFVYYIDGLDSKTYGTVPVGFLTDGASVPRLFWSIIPPWGEYGQAAVLHDYLCAYGKISNGLTYIDVSRKTADDIFLQAMTVLEVPKFKRNIMHKAVCFYRELTNAKTPCIDPLKAELEYLISQNHRNFNSFELTQSQINKVYQIYRQE